MVCLLAQHPVDGHGGSGVAAAADRGRAERRSRRGRRRCRCEQAVGPGQVDGGDVGRHAHAHHADRRRAARPAGAHGTCRTDRGARARRARSPTSRTGACRTARCAASTAPSTSAASLAKRPCGELTATGRPTRSRVWSVAMRWMVWPSGMCRRGYRHGPVVEAPGFCEYGGRAVDLRIDHRRTRHLRQLRAVPAALPHVPGHRRRGAVAAWSHRRDAGGAAGGRAGRPTTSSSSWRRACSAAAASRRARAACRSGTCMEATRATLGRAAPHHAVVAAPGVPGARPPPAAARRVVGAGGGPASCIWCRSGWVSAALPVRRPPPLRGYRQRRVAVHRLRDGRVAARRAPRHRDGARRHRRHVVACPARGLRAAGRCTCTPGSPTRRIDWPRR